MARRPAFSLANTSLIHHPILMDYYDFEWSPGMSRVQKQKNVVALHAKICESVPGANPLEISTKSTLPIGVALSAFNLTRWNQGSLSCVESLYQASKVFQDGRGPFPDLYDQSPMEVRSVLKTSAAIPLARFEYSDTSWPLLPRLAFYTWLYCHSLHQVHNRGLADQLIGEHYTHFTDIEYNPRRTLNSQSFAVAYYVHLRQTGQTDSVLANSESFLSVFPLDLPSGLAFADSLSGKTNARDPLHPKSGASGRRKRQTPRSTSNSTDAVQARFDFFENA